jgi:hypothetical protein
VAIVTAAPGEENCQIPPLNTTTQFPLNWIAELNGEPTVEGGKWCFHYRFSKPQESCQDLSGDEAQACNAFVSHFVLTPPCVNATRREPTFHSDMCDGNDCDVDLTYRDNGGDTFACGWKFETPQGSDEPESFVFKVCFNQSISSGRCPAWFTIKGSGAIMQVKIENGAPCCTSELDEEDIPPPPEESACPDCDDSQTVFSSLADPCNTVSVEGSGKCVSLAFADSVAGPACTITSN